MQGERQSDCQTRNYRAATEDQCGCLPFSLKDYRHTSDNKVSLSSVVLRQKVVCPTLSVTLTNHRNHEVAVCGAEKSACLAQIPLQTADCLEECQGLFVTNIVRQQLNTAWSPGIRRALDQYDRYKQLQEEPVKFSQEISGLITTLSLLYLPSIKTVDIVQT